MGKRWNKKEEEFLKENYPTQGLEYCHNKLDRNKKSIICKTNKLNLKLEDKVKSKILKKFRIKDVKEYKINPNQFFNIKSKKVAYFLGFLWADGHITKTGYNINIEIKKEDMNYVKPIFDSLGIWGYYERNRNNWATQSKISTNNYHIHKFLKENDYHIKSYESPDKILSKIPEYLKHYFFRGWSDGDGCFISNHNYHNFVLTGDKSQKWNATKFLVQELGIKNYRIIINENKKSSSSYLKISNKKDIALLGDYLYQGFSKDKIGLPRKYHTYETIKEKSSKTRYLTPEQRNKAIENNLGAKNPAYKNVNVGVITEMREKGQTLQNIADHFNVSIWTIRTRLKP